MIGKMSRALSCLVIALVLSLMLVSLAFAAAPAAPVLTLGTVGANYAVVSWEPVATATTYKVYLGGSLYAAVGGTSVVVGGLAPETAFSITAKASNVDGDSAASTAVSGTTLAAGAGVGEPLAQIAGGVAAMSAKLLEYPMNYAIGFSVAAFGLGAVKGIFRGRRRRR